MDTWITEARVLDHIVNRVTNPLQTGRLALTFTMSVLIGGGWLLAESPVDSVSEEAQITKTFDVIFSHDAGDFGKCDLYRLASGRPDGKRFPVVIVVHGGGWISGDKWTMGTHSKILARQGYFVVNVNYRLAPATKFPAQVDDIRDALVWVHDHENEYDLDLNRVGLFGYSAGAHLSGLVAVLANEELETQLATSHWQKNDPRWKRMPTIKTVCLGGPPCDFRIYPPDNTTLAYFLGGSKREKPDVYRLASPTALVSPGDPPTQIIHGDKDFLVPIQGSEAFQKAADAAKVLCELHVVAGQGHVLTFMHEQLQTAMVRWFAGRL